MSETNVLQSYLVRIGVDLDTESLYKFFETASKGLENLASLGGSAVGSIDTLRNGVMELGGTANGLKEVGENAEQAAESIDKFDGATEQAEKSTDDFSSSLSGMSKIAGQSVLALVKLGTAAMGAFGTLRVALLKIASSEADLKDLGDRLGMTVEDIERLGYVASQSGSSYNALQSSLESLKQKAGDAAMGMAGARRAFDDIGVSVFDVNGNIKDTATLFDDVGRAMAGLDSGQQLAALRRFGMDRTLIKTLTVDSRELRAEFDMMAKATGVDFRKTTEAAADFMDEFGKAKSFARMIIEGFSGGLISNFRDSLMNARKWIIENIETVQKVIQGAIKVVESGAILASRFLMRIGQAVGWLHEKTSGLSTAMAAFAAVVMWLGGPVTLVAGALAGVFLVIDDLMTALEGGKSYFNWKGWLESIRAVGMWIGDLAGKVKNALVGSIKSAKDWLDNAATSLFKGIEKAADAVINTISGILAEVMNFVRYLDSGAWAVAKGAFNQVEDAVEAVIGVMERLSNFLINVLTGNFSSAFGDIKGVVEIFEDYFSKTFSRIQDLVLGVTESITDAIDKLKEFLGLGTPDAPQQPESNFARLEAVPSYIAGSARNEQPFEMDAMPEDTARRVAALRTTPDNEFYQSPFMRQSQPFAVPPTNVGPWMLQTAPLGVGVAQPHSQGSAERPIELNQNIENNFTFSGNNPHEVRRQVSSALDDVNRNAGNIYRNSIGRM